MQKVLSVVLILIVLFTTFTACISEQENRKSSHKKEVIALSDTVIEQYRDQGRFISKSSFQALSSKLTSALQTGGVPHAVSFCNIEAMPIMDSLTKEFDVSIKRVSDKNRNPDNGPDAFEKIILDLFNQNLNDFGFINDTVLLDENNSIVYAAPILITPPCLQCHGVVGTDISDENFKIIKELYPDDKASAYALSDLRGIWRIRFESKEN